MLPYSVKATNDFLNGISSNSIYNKSAKIKWKRIIIVCDEIAEILDSTGKSREEKALTSQIERNLRTLARMGRFAGIHLTFSTQRPSAEVIDGDIKKQFWL